MRSLRLPGSRTPRSPRCWRAILSLLEKNPARRPASGNAVALELTEEAERARRLERISTRLWRSDPQLPVAPPTTTSIPVVNPKAKPAAADGTGRIDPGTVVPSDPQTPPARPGGPDATGIPED